METVSEMAFVYEMINGERVETHVAAAFRGWARDFKAATGYDMLISSGTRTKEEQQRGYEDYLAGRTTVKWAKPSESSHCEIGPSGPRALDIRDTGADSGVTVKGSYRWNVAVRLGKKWGFTWGGWGVPDYEGWHFENHVVPVGGAGNGSAGSGMLAEDGEWGPATTRALQLALGVAVDGQMGPITVGALQDRLIAVGYPLSRDSDLGPATIRALQTFLLGHKLADGEIGPQTIRGLQHYLNSGGKFVIAKPPAAGKLTVDGDWGPATTKALQKLLGVTQDGEIGPATTTALQKALGIPVDGDWGPQTTKGLQIWLGVTADGEIGPATTTALQNALNAGKALSKVTLPTEPAPGPGATPRTPTYPKAIRGWNVPLASARAAGDAIEWLILHHQGSTNDDEGYFKTANSRGSCPTIQIKANGDAVEFIPPHMKPSSSGEANGRSVAIETQNTSGNVSGTSAVKGVDWGISEASHEAIAQYAAWLSQQKTINGVAVKVTLDRDHIFGDNEITAKTGIKIRATACPGPSMDMDWIVERAKEIVAGVIPDPEPEPEPEPSPVDPVLLKEINEAYDHLGELIKKLND